MKNVQKNTTSYAVWVNETQFWLFLPRQINAPVCKILDKVTKVLHVHDTAHENNNYTKK